MPDKYQTRALATWHKELEPVYQRLHAVLGLVGEAGEVAELLKKDCYKPGAHSSRDRRIEELGDVFYYLCILTNLEGVTIDELSQINADKLKDGHGWVPDFTIF